MGGPDKNETETCTPRSKTPISPEVEVEALKFLFEDNIRSCQT